MRLSIVSAIAALFILSPFQVFAESEEDLGAMCDTAWALMWSADTSPQDLEKAEALLTQVAEHWAFVHSDLGLIALRLRNDTAAAKGDPMAADALATAIAAGHIASSDPKVEAPGWRILAGLRFGRADEVETRLRQEGLPDDILTQARAWAAERLRDFPKASP